MGGCGGGGDDIDVNDKEMGEDRGPKNLNFPDGNFQRAKTFRTKCVNRFRDKKVCVNSFCDKKGVYRLFLQQNKCAQIIFATFQAIRKLSRYPKLSRLSGNFLDHPENIQPIRKISRQSGKNPDYLEIFQRVRKLLSAILRVTRKNFPDAQKLSGWQCPC